MRERLEEPCVGRGIRRVHCKRLLVGLHGLIKASKSGKDTAYAHIGGRVRREGHRLLKGDEGFVVARQSSECVALASESSGIGAVLLQSQVIG
jgi:hypothetical protein